MCGAERRAWCRAPSASAPKPARSDIRALAQRAKLGPHDVLRDHLPRRERAEAAIDAGDYPRAISDRLGHAADSVSHDLWMLDDAGSRIDYPRDDRHPIGRSQLAQHLVLVLLA